MFSDPSGPLIPVVRRSRSSDLWVPISGGSPSLAGLAVLGSAGARNTTP